MLNWLELTAILNRPIAFHRVFAEIGGGAIPGLFLSQAFYWTSRTKDTDGWFYKTQEEWQQETALTRAEQESARKKLKALKILEEKKQGLPCKLYFRINKEVLCQQINGSIVPEMNTEEFLTIHGSALLGLSKSHLARAEKLGCEKEFIDYRNVLRIHGLKCCICLSPIKRGLGNRDDHLVFDHFLPLNRGGTHTFNNVFPAHTCCNTLKKDSVLGEQTRMSRRDKQGCPDGTNRQDLLDQASESHWNDQVSPGGTNNLYTENTSETTSESTSETTPIPPLPKTIEVEVVEPKTREETSTTSLAAFSINSEVLGKSEFDPGDSFSAAEFAEDNQIDLEKLKEAHAIAYNWRQRPWRVSQTEFHPQMVKAVWQSNVQEFSLQGSGAPNRNYIRNFLKKLDRQLLGSATEAIEAYTQLQVFWQTVQDLDNPMAQMSPKQSKAAQIYAQLQQKYAQEKS